MFILLSTLWLIQETKYILFWLFLWQLKDYHIGRFVDHFRTHKGRKLILNVFLILKLILLVLFLLVGSLYIYLFYALTLVYILEAAALLKGFLNNSIRKPKATLKILFLLVVSFAVTVLFFMSVLRAESSLQPMLILGFDILTSVIVSIIVLLFQPIFVSIRNNTLRKAKEKIEKIKSASGVTVIAITGSYGKTSTKELLATILSKKYKVLKTSEHQNSEIGVANCILRDLKSTHEFFIAEVGAYNKGKVKEVCSILKPKIGIVTGINEQHLALFGSLENLLSAEGGEELADMLPEDGMLVVNGDNKFCLDLYKRRPANLPRNKKIYSLSNKALNSDIWANDITINKRQISFLAVNKSGELAHFEANVLGRQNVQNLLGAILVAKELGMSFGEISDACEDISQNLSGMSLKQGKYGIDIIDSSYSANPDGVYADLDYFSIYSGKKVIVMPCLIELGKKSAEIHEKIGTKIGQVCDLAIITSKDKFENIKRGAIKAGMKEKNIILCDNPKNIYSLVTLSCKEGDAVLLEGRVSPELINLLTSEK